MSTPEPVPASPISPRRAGMPGLLAAAILGLQALACAVFAALSFFVVPQDSSLTDTSHVMFSIFTALFAVGLGVVAWSLWRARKWPRTAAVVWLALLLPVGWAMVQAGRWLVGALILGSALAGIGAVAAESRNRARP